MPDLMVAGGGPAGLATALYAARAGLSVVVREPRAGAIDKACGEGLMPGALGRLQELGIDPAGQPLRGIHYLPAESERGVRACFRNGPGRGVRRTALHAALREAVSTAGVRIEQRPVEEVRQEADGVVVDGDRARYLVAADGLHSPIRHRLGLDAGRGPTPDRRYGLRRHVETVPWTDMVQVHWSGDAEAYVTPVAEDLVGIALLTRRRAPFDEQLTAFPVLAERVAAGSAQPVLGAGPLRQGAVRRVAGRVLLVGDAAGYVDALTGEGVSLALAQAEAAVTCIASGDVAAYEQVWRTVTRRYRWITEALVRGTRGPAGRRVLIPTAQRLPSVFAAAVNQLARPA